MSTTKKKSKKKTKSATAFHGKAKDGRDFVVLGNLRVVIVKDEDAWFAQGLEIDYAVQGSSVENVKQKFERGLCATIHENLKAHGNIEGILRVAPQAIWDELFFNPSRKLKEYSSVSLHAISESLKLEDHTPQVNLPFDAIRFVESRPAA